MSTNIGEVEVKKTKSRSEVQAEILDAISANVVEAKDTEYPESANVSAQTARILAETYRLLEAQP